MGAFFDLGPTVTEGAYVGAVPPAIPFAEELARYASILSAAAAGGLAVYDAISPSDLDARPEPAGARPLGSGIRGLPPARQRRPREPGQPARCGFAVGCESGYYAVERDGRVGARARRLRPATYEQVQREWVEHRSGEPGPGQAGDRRRQLRPRRAARHARQRSDRAGGGVVGENRLGRGRPQPMSPPRTSTTRRKRTSSSPWSGQRISTFGSGTLGYELASNEAAGDFHGAKGILLGEVHLAERKNPTTKRPSRCD